MSCSNLHEIKGYQPSKIGHQCDVTNMTNCPRYSDVFGVKKQLDINHSKFLNVLFMFTTNESQIYFVNSVPLGQNGPILQMMFSGAFSWMKNFVFLIKNSIKFVPKGPIRNNTALV